MFRPSSIALIALLAVALAIVFIAYCATRETKTKKIPGTIVDVETCVGDERGVMFHTITMEDSTVVFAENPDYLPLYKNCPVILYLATENSMNVSKGTLVYVRKLGVDIVNGGEILLVPPDPRPLPKPIKF